MKALGWTISHRFGVCRLQPLFPSVRPLSHRARIVVIVVMVGVIGVCDLQAGFPLWLFAISCFLPSATWWPLLKEVRHKAHLQRRGEESRG